MRTRCIHGFCTLGADLYAQLVLTNKISASELRRKFIKSALLVGQWAPPLCATTGTHEFVDSDSS